MDNMSNKAKVVYAALKEMGAVNKESKVFFMLLMFLCLTLQT